MVRDAQAGPARSLKARAIQWLAQREHSRQELRRKLLPHATRGDAPVSAMAAGSETSGADCDRGSDSDSSQAEVDALLDWLEANHYLSQQRFVESRVHARAARFGNLRIRQELAQHQIALPADVESALRATELDRARAIWRARYSGRPADPASRARQSRFMASRGFSAEVIYRVLREAGNLPEAEEGDSD
jgi:regulatory protein